MNNDNLEPYVEEKTPFEQKMEDVKSDSPNLKSLLYELVPAIWNRYNTPVTMGTYFSNDSLKFTLNDTDEIHIYYDDFRNMFSISYPGVDGHMSFGNQEKTEVFSQIIEFVDGLCNEATRKELKEQDKLISLKNKHNTKHRGGI